LADIFGDRGVLVWEKRPWMFMMFFRSTKKRGSKKGKQIEAPKKGIYATDVRAEIS